MAQKITITVPDNCELQKNGNSYTIVEKEEKFTYNDIAKKLFYNKEGFFITTNGAIISGGLFGLVSCTEANNCISKRQAEKLLAINKLMNVAKYLNGDWHPHWEIIERKWYIYLNVIYKKIEICYETEVQNCTIYFKSEELAKKAIEILGEDTVKLALCTDY